MANGVLKRLINRFSVLPVPTDRTSSTVPQPLESTAKEEIKLNEKDYKTGKRGYLQGDRKLYTEESHKLIQDNLKALKKQTEKNGTVKGFMKAKVQLMKQIVSSLPLGGGHCPYCLADPYLECEECQYREVHGKDYIQDGSDYDALGDTINELRARLGLYGLVDKKEIDEYREKYKYVL